MLEDIQEYKSQCETIWEQFKEMILESFDPKFANKELFMNIFA